MIQGELQGRGGETVEIRYMPHDGRRIEIFRDGRWLATARPQATLSADEREAVLRSRHTARVKASRELRRARSRERRRYAPITAPGEVDETTIVTPAQARSENSANRDWSLAKAARGDLLNLGGDLDSPVASPEQPRARTGPEDG